MDIYSGVGFKKLGKTIYSDKIINEARRLFSDFPSKPLGIRSIVVEQTAIEESFAISAAEDSDLTLQDAKKIIISPEIEARLIKYRDNNNLSSKEKYDLLEAENVQAVEQQIQGITFGELTVEILLDLHYKLTIGLDEYCKQVGISFYHPGEIRATNETRVGKIRKYEPPNHNKIPKLLNLLFSEFQKRKKINLTDILEFHILLYAIHPFSNGNKRVARVLESMLLMQYGYSADHMLSLAMFYGIKKSATNLFLIESLQRKDPAPFVNFAIRGYFYSGRFMEQKIIKAHLKPYLSTMISLLSGFFKKEKIAAFQAASDSILEMNGIFTHGEFIRLMDKKGYTLGVSQELLKYLKKNNYISHKKNLYCVPGASDLAKHRERLLKFYIKNQILVED